MANVIVNLAAAVLISAGAPQEEGQVARIAEWVKPRPGDPRTNMARVTSWQTNAWEAAVKAAREGKPILVFGGHAGVSAGFC